MRSVQIHNGHFIVLSRGEEVITALRDFCEEKDVHWGQLNAIGAVEDVDIGYYDIESRKYVFSSEPGPFEVASMNGNIAEIAEEPFIHLHAVLSRVDQSLGCIGGHIRYARVALTLEICLWEVTQPLMRRRDEDTGLNLIDLQA